MTSTNVKRTSLGFYIVALLVCLACVGVLSLGSGDDDVPEETTGFGVGWPGVGS